LGVKLKKKKEKKKKKKKKERKRKAFVILPSPNFRYAISSALSSFSRDQGLNQKL
jgi:hypothetical protein